MKEEPPDGQAAAGAPGELPQPSAGNSHRDIVSLLGDDAEDDSTSRAAAEPASAAAPTPDQPEGASQQGEASTVANAAGRKRKAAQEEGGPCSKKHGVGSMRALSGRWRWRVAGTADQPDQTFPLDEGKVAWQAYLICVAVLTLCCSLNPFCFQYGIVLTLMHYTMLQLSRVPFLAILLRRGY